ncbi:MAG TPA: hypothetical protein VM142_13950 [Acidimicrobiales bacterium]|nr:hypothetical protein [Acidimicrobiales bacterium]
MLGGNRWIVAGAHGDLDRREAGVLAVGLHKLAHVVEVQVLEADALSQPGEEQRDAPGRHGSDPSIASEKT